MVGGTTVWHGLGTIVAQSSSMFFVFLCVFLCLFVAKKQATRSSSFASHEKHEETQKSQGISARCPHMAGNHQRANHKGDIVLID